MNSEKVGYLCNLLRKIQEGKKQNSEKRHFKLKWAWTKKDSGFENRIHVVCANCKIVLNWLLFSGQFKDVNLNDITTAMADIYWRHSTDRKQMAVKELNKSLNRLCYYSSNGKWFFYWVALSWDLDFKASTWPALISRIFWTGEELGNIIVEYNSMFSHFFTFRTEILFLYCLFKVHKQNCHRDSWRSFNKGKLWLTIAAQLWWWVARSANFVAYYMK